MSKQTMTDGAVMLEVLGTIGAFVINGADSRILAMQLGIPTHRVERALHELMNIRWCCHDPKRDLYYPRAELWAFAIATDGVFAEADQKISAQQLDLMGFDPKAAITKHKAKLTGEGDA